MLYDFKKPFTLSMADEDKEITFIELNEPCGDCSNEVCKIEAVYNRAIKSSQESIQLTDEVIENAKDAKDESKKAKDEDKEKKEKNPDDFWDIVMVGGVNPVEAFQAIKKILKITKSKLNGEFPCTGTYFESMPYRIQKEIIGAYFVNFTSISD